MKGLIFAATAMVAAMAASASSAATYSYDGSGGDLPDLVDFSTVIAVPDAFTISDLNITLNDLTHSFWADLEIFLSHDGVTVALADDNGGGSDPNGTFTFDDEAAVDVGSINTAGGSFRPLNALSAFDGQSAAGVWTLRIRDDAGADAGALRSWNLTFTDGAAVPEPTTWALMIMGFGAAGAAMRRRRVQATA